MQRVQVILAFVRDVSSENLALALTRGRADVVNLFGLWLLTSAFNQVCNWFEMHFVRIQV